jgi:preprotein translocase subunit SecA
VETLHHVNQALKAHTIFKIDVDYVVKDDQVLIVDEFTGRLMPGRRYSDGLHQALEAKEGVKIENENQTLATITFQNYFRLYNTLSGMTGTADTEAEEFMNIYKLEVIIIPTNMPMIRDDQADLIYRTLGEKDQAIIDDIVESHKRGQPILVGTISIEKSEQISNLLKRKGVKHNVLNAKLHEKEAEIVAQAGRKGAVTIATNMAGRGTDIVLGGNAEKLLEQQGLDPEEDREAFEESEKEMRELCEAEKQEVLGSGGLRIIGTERHESRRIDNQLRGRSGRQGDPGASRFYLSLEDDLMRIFGSEKISNLMERLGMEEGVPIEHKMVSRAIENAQKRVEGHNFDARKHILEYDDVMNKQREVIYGQRRMILEGADLREEVIEFGLGLADSIVYEHIGEKAHPDEWDVDGFKNGLAGRFDIPVSVDEKKDLTIGAEKLLYESMLQDDVLEAVQKAVEDVYKRQEESIGEERIRGFERYILLNVLDNQWKEHLLMMDHLKEGINFRGYAQKNPLSEYKREGHDLFQGMIERFKEEVATILFRAKVEDDAEVPAQRTRASLPMIESRGESADAVPVTVRRDTKKVGRNDPCPCGSGKKYKKCHGAGK